MKNILLLAVLTALPAAAAEKTFGVPPTLTDAVPLSKAVASPEAYEDGEILLVGRVLKVCQKKGCWMVLKDEGASKAEIKKVTEPVETVSFVASGVSLLD